MAVHCEILDDPTGVAVVTLDRQDRRNALDHAHLTELRAAVRSATDDGVRALVLTGKGRNFCAGADLSTVEDDAFVAALRGTLEDLRTAPFAVIGAIHGPALGAGTQLAMACDLRLATRGATFGIPAAKLGLTVDSYTVHHLADAAGHAIARAMLIGTEVFDGATLAASGFVHRLVDNDVEVRAAGVAWAAEIARLAPLTIAAHKAMLADAEVPVEPSTAAIEARLTAWRSEDLAAGLAAFAEKRRPEFRCR
jgi:enoyl-CoA hydratase